jgi:phage N-6-adenine-methyltransferase
MSINAAMYSSATDRHNTPRWLVERIADFLDGIELDPCTDESNPCGAERFYTEATDGLAHIWIARSLFCNPPYGRAIGDWTGKLVREYRKGLIDEAITLLPARTDTQWWNGLAKFPVCFLRGRLQFNDCGQSAPFPSALVYLGDNWRGFRDAFGELGIIYLPMGYVERIRDSYRVRA